MSIAPSVTRGRLTVLSTGDSRSFQFNPNEVTDDKGVNWGTLDVPGASHPIYQYGTGGERIISFELYLDGDRGRYGRAEFPPSEYLDLSIQSEINFYRSLVYPSQYDSQDFAAVYPYMLSLSMGNYFKALPCIIKSPPTVKITYWTPKMDPVRATVSMSLSEVVSRSQTSAEVLGYSAQIGNFTVNGVLQLDEIRIEASRKSKVIRLPPTTITARSTNRNRSLVLPTTTIVGRTPTQLPTQTIRARTQLPAQVIEGRRSIPKPRSGSPLGPITIAYQTKR